MSTFLVTGATGQQGRATVDALLARGAKVHAVVRDPTKAAARELERLGVTLFKGDHDDFDIFRKAAQGCSGIFLNLLERPGNPHPERQAQGILAACFDAGVEHVVLSTAGWVGSREKWDIPANRVEVSEIIPYYEGEVLVEDAVRRAGLKSYTILRPFWFHSNYLVPTIDFFHAEVRKSGELVHSYDDGTTFPHINVRDIGQFAAMALTDPARFAGEEIELASENLAIEEVAELMSKVTGQHIAVRKATAEEAAKPSPTTQWHIWANAAHLTVDVEALAQKYGYRFTTLGEYLTQQHGLQYLQ
ncbi:NmrA family protein [Xylaria cf. heliscus]|nr:NmrA family protein [Xylaria cf. heliscus]